LNIEGIDVQRMSEVAREKRKTKGFSQKSLADQFGLSDNYIGLLERGDVAKLNQDNVEKILSLLGLSLSEFRNRGAAGPEKMERRLQEQAALPYDRGVNHGLRPERRASYDRPIPAAPAKRPDPPGRPDRGGAGPSSSNQQKQFTGKELQRHWEWVRFRTPLTVKLLNGDELQGFLKWTDQFSVKLVGQDAEYVIPKHSILYYAEAPRAKWSGPPQGR